jgi:hypothetical protein
LRKWFSNASLAALAVSQIACLPSAPPVSVFRVGDRVQVGPLFFNVLDSKWRAQIGEGAVARVPEHRFLIIRLAVTNSGAQEITLPNLTVVDQAGKVFDETMDGRAVPSWLGMIRKLKPADTLDGMILFDLEPKSYKLRLDDGSGVLSSMVDLPLQFDAGEAAIPSPVAPAASP